MRILLLATYAAFAAAMPMKQGWAAEPVTAAPATAAQPLLVPFADHFSMRVNRPAGEVWKHIKALYVAGDRPRQQGYLVTPLSTDPAAWLGGIVGEAPAKSDRPKVTIRVSTLDEEAMLLTLEIELENPVPVYVVHQVRPDGAKAAIYQTIIQTRWPVTPKPGETLSPQAVARVMTEQVKRHNQEVGAIMQREKAILESARK